MELQFIQVNQPGLAQRHNLQESDMRRHAARVAHKRLKSKNLNSTKPSWQVVTQPPTPVKRSSTSESKHARKSSQSGYEGNNEHIFQVLVRTSSPQILEIDDTAGKITPKWLPFWQQMISKGSREFCQVFNCRDVVSAEDTSQWILHEGYIDFCAASMLFLYQKLVDPISPPRPEVHEHRMKAFASLRKELENNGPTDVALLAICGLIGMEKQFGTEENLRLHSNMLSQLVEQRGGLDNIHEFVRASILQFTLSWGWNQFCNPKLITCGPAMHYPVVPLSLLQHLPLGFQKLVEGGHIPTDVLNVLIRITDVHLQQRRSNDAHINEERKSLRLIISDAQGVHPDPISACPTMSMPDEGEFIFQKALCQSLYHYVAWNIAPFSPLVRNTLGYRMALTEKLPTIAEQKNELQERCLFWMWQIVIDTWWMSKTTMAPPGNMLKEEQARRFGRFYELGETEKIVREFSWDGASAK